MARIPKPLPVEAKVRDKAEARVSAGARAKDKAGARAKEKVKVKAEDREPAVAGEATAEPIQTNDQSRRNIMPGFNQQGPMNQGPMTGGGRGTCANGSMPGATGFGSGRSRGPGFGARGSGGGFRRGRGFCQGQGWGQGYAPENAASPAPATRETLAQRADQLEAELNAVKEELANLSKS